MKKDKNIKIIKKNIKKKYENMSNQQKRLLTYKKYYAEKKLKMILSHQ